MPATYADSQFYFSVVGGDSSNTDPRIDALLELASRLYDKASGVAPGMWAPISSQTFTFNASGSELLRLRDSNGWQYFLRTITADSCKVDDDGDGAYDDFLLDLSDAWLRGLPEHAPTFGGAYTRLELLNISSATLTQWPVRRAGVQITGTWGMPATPPAIKLRVVDIAHGLSQRGYAGGYGTEEALQQDVPVWVVRMIDREYDHTRRKSA